MKIISVSENVCFYKNKEQIFRTCLFDKCDVVIVLCSMFPSATTIAFDFVQHKTLTKYGVGYVWLKTPLCAETINLEQSQKDI